MIPEYGELGAFLAVIVGGMRIIERTGDWLINKARPPKYLSGRQDRMLNDLHDWLEVVDPDTQARAIYVPKSLGVCLKEITTAQREIVISQTRMVAILERMERRTNGH